MFSEKQKVSFCLNLFLVQEFYKQKILYFQFLLNLNLGMNCDCYIVNKFIKRV